MATAAITLVRSSRSRRRPETGLGVCLCVANFWEPLVLKYTRRGPWTPHQLSHHVSCCHGFVSFAERRRCWKWLNSSHAPAILVVAALALLCGLRVERTHSIPWALLCDLRVSGPALYLSRRKAVNDASYVVATVALSRLVPWPRVAIVATAAQSLHFLLVAGVLRNSNRVYMILVLARRLLDVPGVAISCSSRGGGGPRKAVGR